MLTVIAFILVLSVLVLVHELGHFLVAKKLGIKVEEFGFGFPPRLFGFKKGETVYSINALPFGGFVKLYGEDEAGGGKAKGAIHEPVDLIKKKDVNRTFFARPAWQRLIVVIAGVMMNFLLAVVLISYLFAARGVPVPTENIKVVEVLKESPADKFGIRGNDEIVSFNGERIGSIAEFVKKSRENQGSEAGLKIKRGGEVLDIKVVLRKEYPKGQGPLGIVITGEEIKKYPWYQAPVFGTYEAMKYSVLLFKGIGKTLFDFVVHGVKPQGVAGPIGVAELTGRAVSRGFDVTFWFVSLLSLNLAVLNILPIPALDGGRLLFIVVELVTRKKVNPKYESYAHAIGLAILLALIVLVTIQDVLRLVSGKSIFPAQ